MNDDDKGCVLNALTDQNYIQQKKNYCDIINKFKKDINSLHLEKEKLSSMVQPNGITMIDSNYTQKVFRNRYILSHPHAIFIENPCYLLTFPEPCKEKPWKKDQILPISDPPFEKLSWSKNGNTVLQTDCHIQSLIQSLNCGGYYKLRCMLSDIYMTLRLILRKIEADIIISYIAINHGFQCHCLAKLFCANCPESYREILSKQSINEYLPVSIDFKIQICQYYAQFCFNIVKMDDKIPEKWASNVKKALPKRNKKDESIKTVFVVDSYDCFDAEQEILNKNKVYLQDTLQYDVIEYFYAQKYNFSITKPTNRLIFFLPLQKNNLRNNFDTVCFMHKHLKKTISFNDALLLSDTNGDWFHICVCMNQKKNDWHTNCHCIEQSQKLLMQSKKSLENRDLTNCFSTNQTNSCSLSFEPNLQENIFIYTEQWNATISNSNNSCILFV